MYDYDTDDFITAYGLPELPGPDEDDPEGRELVLVRFQGDSVVLAEGIPLADAQEYCQREDTRGDGWFVGYRQ